MYLSSYIFFIFSIHLPRFPCISEITNPPAYLLSCAGKRNSDVVKKVNLKNNPFFLVSLIEHKSDVDYNVIMQVFRYIAFIWEDYEKEQERIHSGISKTKDFKYPPILPVIFYDGADSWTAATSLHERVLFSDVLGKYIPDYHCLLIQLKDYSNTELMEKRDELSVLMLIDKLKNGADYTELKNDIQEDFLETVLKKSPEYLLKLMSEIIETFLSKLKIPQEEVDAFTDKIKERKVGELFKYFEGWDVQALRKEADDARKDADDARKDADDARKEANDARKKADDAEKKIIETRESDIRKLLNSIKKFHATRNDAVAQLKEEYQLSADEAEKKVNLYWR